MAKKWNDVVNNPEYQKLDAAQKEAARNEYFEFVVKPNVPDEDLEKARAEFDSFSTPSVSDKLSNVYKEGLTGLKNLGMGALRKTVETGMFGLDRANDLVQGAITVPEAVVGLADIPTGGRVGKALEEVGYKPGEAKQYLTEQFSNEQKAANQAVSDADGFIDKSIAAIQNPRSIVSAVTQSAPLMGAGGVVGRGAVALGANPVIAGAVGEGVVSAGSAAEGTRQQTKDGLLTGKQSGLAVASGLGTALTSVFGGKLAQKLGIADIDTVIAGGVTEEVKKSLAKRLVLGGMSEGVFEEMPQSIQEQILSNIALDKPLTEGVDEAAAMGLLSGAAMGGGASALLGGKNKEPNEEDNGQRLTISQGNPADDALAAQKQAEYDAAQSQLQAQKSEKLKTLPDQNLQNLRKTAQTLNPADVPVIDAEIERRASLGTLSRAAEISQQVDPLAVQQQAAPVIPATNEAINAADLLEEDNVSDLPSDAVADVVTDATQESSNNFQGSVGNLPDQYAGRGNTGRADNAAETPAQSSGSNQSAGNGTQGGDSVAILNGEDVAERPFAQATDDFLPKMRSMTTDAKVISQIDEELKLRGIANVDGVNTPAERVDETAKGVHVGEKINKEWTAFSPESGTLNIPRSEMPQVKAEHRGAMVNFLNARGVDHTQETVPASSLKPTQQEFSEAKVKKASKYAGGDRAILVSSDNHVLDGHHQWLSKLNKGGDVDVIRLNAPITQLLNDVKEFPSSTVESGATTSKVQKPKSPKQYKPKTLLATLRDLGGIKLSEKQDVTGEEKGFAPGGYNRVFKQASNRSLKGLIESGDLDEYLPYNMRLESNGMNDDAFDSTEAYDYLADKIRNGESVLPYDAEQEIAASKYYDNQDIQNDIDVLAEELDLVTINALLQEAGHDERESTTEAAIYESEGSTSKAENTEQASADGGIGSGERETATAATNASQQAEVNSAIEKYNLPEGTVFKQGKALAAGKWIAEVNGISGNMEQSIPEAAASLGRFIQNEQDRKNADANRIELSRTVAGKIKRGVQPSDLELEELFGLQNNHDYVKLSNFGWFATDYLGIPRNKIHESLGKAGGISTSNFGAKYKIVYPRKLHEVFGNKEAIKDLLGDNTATKQAIADAERAKDAKRNSGNDNQDTFTLTGSNSEADQAAAAGAQDLFSAPIKQQSNKEASTGADVAENKANQSSNGQANDEASEIEYNGVRLYKIKVRNRVEGQPPTEMWAVESTENKARKARGERAIGGDNLSETLDEAKAEADLMLKRDAENKQAQALQNERDNAQQEQMRTEAEKKSDIDGFGAELNAMQLGKLKETLNKPTSINGVVSPLRDAVRNLVAKGGKPEIKEENVYKGMSRAQYNRADNRAQQEDEKRIRDGGKKNVYYITMPDGGMFELGKTAHDFAEHLIAKAESKPQDEVAKATEALTAAGVKGKEKLDTIKDVREGKVTADEVADAYAPEETKATSIAIPDNAGMRKALTKLGYPNADLSRTERRVTINSKAVFSTDQFTVDIELKNGKWKVFEQSTPNSYTEEQSGAMEKFRSDLSILNGDVDPIPAKSKVDDFGEKLEGARKDMVRAMAKEYSDDELVSLPLSKIWPITDVNLIENKTAAAIAWTAREEIPSKPRKPYALKVWVGKVKILRDIGRIVSKALEVNPELMLQKLKDAQLGQFKSKVALLEAIDRDAWKRIGKVEEYPNAYSYVDGVKQIKPMVRIDVDGVTTTYEASSVADVIDNVNEKLGKEKQEKRMAFEVRGSSKGGYFINKKGDKNYTKLKTFDSSKEAFEFLRNNYDEVVAAWDATKDRLNVKESDVRNKENRPRTGEDYRKGKDVSSEEFATTFGFRGIQFGEWVKQGGKDNDRQGALNAAYDALMDLANIINVPPKALSLEGTLGLSFGARGKGSASAHFEPNTLVINLTKTQGAGTLAHEWFHALDNYFSRKRGGEKSMAEVKSQQAYREGNFITYKPEALYINKNYGNKGITKAELERYRKQSPNSKYWSEENWILDPKHPQGVRPEVEVRFADLVDALNTSPMKQRARSIDGVKEGTDGYWSRIIELGARAFENYVIHKMQLNGYDNDYLANVVRVDSFNRDSSRFPYLLDEEVAPVAEAFDNLFGEIQTKETDSGNVVMFSRSSKVKEIDGKTKVTEYGNVFETGKPVTFNYAHNTFSATKLYGKPNKNSEFNRGYEPSGEYVISIDELPSEKQNGYEYGTITFNNPLVIDNDSLNWKKSLSDYFGGLTGKKLSIAVINAGYDGIVTTDGNYTSEIINLQTFDEAKALYSRSNQPTFYSALTRAIEEIKTNKADPRLWKGMIKNLAQKGVKPDEVEWTGVNEWLDLQTSAVTKEQVLEYLNANGVQVTETILGDKWRERVESRMEEINNEVTNLVEEFGIIPDLTGDAKVKYEALEKEFNDLDDRLRSTPEYVDETKYGKYTVAGGKNYKELLLTLPTKINDTPLMSEIKSKLSDPNISQIVRENLTAQLEHFSSKQKLESGFKSSHFVQRNILAHVRFDERVDADGNKTLFIQEIQSDYGQDGKKRGFKLADAEISSMKGYSLAVKIEELNRDWRGDRTSKAEQDKGWAEVEAEKQSKGITDADIKAAKEAIDRNVVALPRAPFVTKTDAWVSLAVKRMVRYAAENGFDKVAFISGEQAADLYDLSKQVKSIYYSKNQDGTYDLDIMTKDDKDIRRSDLSENQLVDNVGKEIAEKIVNSDRKSGSFTGLDLRVGGEGMKSFYDFIVPKVAKDVLKKVGGQVESINMQTVSDEEFEDALDKAADNGEMIAVGSDAYNALRYKQQVGFTITHEMREKVMGGLPLFNRNDPFFSLGTGSILSLEKSKAQFGAKMLNRALVKYFDDTWSDSYESVDVPDTLSQFREEIEVAFGKELRYVRPTDEKFNIFGGVQIPGSPNAIYVNARSNSNLTTIAGHELYHTLERSRPDLHKWFRKQAVQYIQNFGTYRQNLNSKLAKGEKLYKSEVALSELLADFTGDALSDRKFLQELANADGNKFVGLLNITIRFLNEAITKLKNLGSSQYIKDVEALRTHLKKALVAFANGTEITDDSESSDNPSNAELFKTLTINDDLFKYPKSNAKDMQQVFDEVAQGLVHIEKAKSFDDEVSDLYSVYPIGKDGNPDRSKVGFINVYEDGKVEINVLALGEGFGGSRIYAAVGNWAYNNGKVFAGDRESITPTGRLRRLENMISLALKFGTTDHIAPHPDQMDDLEFDWKEGDTEYNLGQMLEASFKAVRNGVYVTENKGTKYELTYKSNDAKGVSKLDDLVYDFDKHQFTDVSNGQEYTESDFDKLARTAEARNTYAGRTTLQRAAIGNTFMGATGEGKRSLLEQLGKLSLQPLQLTDPQLAGIFYSRSTPNPPQSRLTPQWQTLEDSTLSENLRRTLQDKNIDLKRVTQNIKAAGVNLADRWDAYLQEELYHGRAAKRVKDFMDFELTPLIEDMRARNVSMDDLQQYLWNSHAEERNIQIAKVNPDMKDGGSGITTQDAQDYLSALTPKEKANYEALAARVYAINAGSRQTLVDYGLESAGTIATWNNTYKKYVPLKRDEMDLGFGMGTGQGFSVKGSATKRAMGSSKEVVDIIANIAQQREQYIIRGEKNRVATALVGLAKTNPNEDFWEVDNPPRIRMIGKESGLVEEYTDPTYKNHPNVIVARIVNKRGEVEERSVVFNKSNERAMQLAASMKNLDVDQMESWLRNWVAPITRYFASVNTQYNPIFGMLNITRDVQGALLNLSTTPIAGKQKDVLINTGKAMAGIYKDMRSVRAGKGAVATQWSTLWEEFQREGGKTGYRDMFANAAERSVAIERSLDPTWWTKTRLGKIVSANGLLTVPEEMIKDKAIKPIFDWLSDYNETLENSVRLAVYKVAIDNGQTKQQAASIAKNISVNFNRKGNMGQNLGALYAFFNASVQGTARIAETLTGKRGQQIVAGGLLFGAMQAVALMLAGFGDEEPPEFVRDRNIIVPLGDKRYATIPMPLGYNAIPNLGRILTEWAMSGFEKTNDRFTHILSMSAEVFNPIGGNGSIMSIVTPTALDPVNDLTQNEDWTGRQISREDISQNAQTAGFTRTKDKTWSGYVEVARFINKLTGGTEYTAGTISPTGDAIDYLVGQAFGGVGRELSKTATTAEALVTGEDLPPYKVPLLGRFYGDAKGQAAQSSEFYDNLRMLGKHETEIKGRRADGIDTHEYRKENPEATLIAHAKQSDKIVRNLRKLKESKVEAGAPASEVKAVDERITKQMQKLNELVRKKKETADQ